MMATMDDWELLEAFCRERSEAAFAELVQRHLPWVHSVAVRHVGPGGLADDIAQSVFILLARKARGLRSGSKLGGWLFRTTRFVASRALRAENRRQAREAKAFSMIDQSSGGDGEVVFTGLTTHLDAAVAALPQSDRAAILLRYYEEKSLREVGRELGLSEEAAKKRVSRAVEKLRVKLERAGVTVSAGTLAAFLADHLVQAAPGGLLTVVCKGAGAGIGVATPALVHETLRAWWFAKIKFALIPILPTLLMVVVSQLPDALQFNSDDPTGITTVAQSAPIPPDARALAPSVARRQFQLRVVARTTGEGISGVRVPVSFVVDGEWRRGDELVTDMSGYCAAPLPAGHLSRWDVGALKDGFVQKFFTWRSDQEEPLPQAHTLELDPAIAIGGRVQDPFGKPIVGAEIGFQFFEAGDSSDREPRSELLGFVGDAVPALSADSAGQWRIALVPPGYELFSIRVTHSNFVHRTFNISKDQPINSTQLRMEDLIAGQAVMVLDPGFELKGRVVDRGGRPVFGARVSWMEGLSYRQDGVSTAADGSFRIRNVAPGQQQFSAWAKGFAPSTLWTDIRQQNDDELIFALEAGAKVPIRIVDDDGIGIAGASASISLPLAHNADYSITTDVEGRASFEGIPVQMLKNVRLFAGADGYFSSRNGTLPVSESEARIQLYKALTVSGAVLDAATGEPVPDFRAIPCDGESYDRSQSAPGRNGHYRVRFSESQTPLRVRIEADGYDPAMSPPLNFRPAEQMLNFALQRTSESNAVKGIVLDSNGAPAANVKVALLSFERGANLVDGRINPSYESSVAVTNERGEFSARPPTPPAHSVVAADPEAGFSLVRLDRSSGTNVITLQPWGRITGKLLITDLPPGVIRVRVGRSTVLSPTIRDGLSYARATIVDAEGRFSFDMVPPGRVTLHVMLDGSHLLIYATPGEVKPGETATINIGGPGKTVRGKMVMADGSTIDWKSQLQSGSLWSAPALPSVKPPDDQHDFEGRVRVLEFFENSAEWRAYARELRSYPVSVASDGTFWVKDVRPGKYNLNLRIGAPALFGGPTLPMIPPGKNVKVEVVVDDRDHSTPLDLGTITIGEASRAAVAR